MGAKSRASQILERVRVLDPATNTDGVADVLIAGGRIEAIAPRLDSADLDDRGERIPGQELILAPALVDLYSHTGEPGYEERETIGSLMSAALHGGFSRISLLPDTVPPIDNPATFALLKEKITSARGDSSPPQVYIWGSLTRELQGLQISEIADLAGAGVIGFTDNRAHDNLHLLRRFLEYAKPFNLPIALVPGNSQLKGNGVMREGDDSLRLGLPGSPYVTETVAIAAIIELVALTKTPVHLMRISTARGVELIARAKESNLPITASACWMHLLLDTRAIGSYDPNLRLEPPLGSESDRLALIRGVQEGVIDAIAADHTPHTYEEKTVAFADAPAGVVGFELVLPLLWQNLVEKGSLSPLELWQALTINPLRCLGKEPGKVRVGEPAELVLFDHQKTWQLTPSNLQSLSSNTPWLNQEVRGKVTAVIVGAKTKEII